MTNYNERLDKVLERLYRIAADTELAADRCDPYAFNGASEAKQAIISLTKELVEEAKPAKAIISDGEMGIDRARKSSANHAIDQFEQNLLKALEEVR